MSSLTCPGCGARLTAGAERCDLCGTPVDADLSADSDAPAAADIPDPVTPPGGEEAGVYCNACGWKNPPTSNFCSRCGKELQVEAARQEIPPGTRPAGLKPQVAAASASPEASTSRTASASSSALGGADAGVTRHVAILIGISVLIVVALYMVTVVSKQRVEPNVEAAVQAPAEVRSAAVIDEHEAIPVADQYAATVDSLRGAIASAEGEAAYGVRRELADYFAEIGRVDRAAIEQLRLARQSDTASDWRRAGQLLFDWMESVGTERKTDVALLTIDAYRTLLEKEPNDLDARASLGWAYQYDPQNPMEAIRQTNMVLEEEPDHLAANYNRGVFLLRINRVDEALEQFERVGGLAEPDSPYQRQAEAWIRTIQQQGQQP